MISTKKIIVGAMTVAFVFSLAGNTFAEEAQGTAEATLYTNSGETRADANVKITPTSGVKAEFIEKRNEVKTQIKAKMEEAKENRKEIQEKRQELEKMRKDEKEQVKSAREDKREEMKDKKEERKNNRNEQLKKHLSNAVEKLTKAIERIKESAGKVESRITKMKEKGTDVTESTRLLAVTKGAIATATTNIEAVKSTVSSLPTDSTLASKIEAVKTAMKTAEMSVRDAHKTLVDSINSLKPGLNKKPEVTTTTTTSVQAQ